MPLTGPYRTQDDLINRVLANLGVLSAGQPTDPEDYSYVQGDLDSVIRELAQLEIAYVSDINAIRSDIFLPLADVVAGECAEKFGFTGASLAGMKDAGIGGGQTTQIGGGAAAKMLKQILRGRPTLEVLRVEYF